MDRPLARVHGAMPISATGIRGIRGKRIGGRQHGTGRMWGENPGVGTGLAAAGGTQYGGLTPDGIALCDVEALQAAPLQRGTRMDGEALLVAQQKVPVQGGEGAGVLARGPVWCKAAAL